MSEFNITVEGGKSVRLPTAGKYCDRDIVVTATGGEDVTAETNEYTDKLASLETAITALETELDGKASGGVSIEAWTGTVDTSGGPLGGVAPILYYIDETLTPRVIDGEGYAIIETITIAANTILFFSTHIDFVLINAEDFISSQDLDSYNCAVIRPTANNFSVIRA